VLVAFALNHPGVIRIEPPLTIPVEVLDEAITRMRKALEGTRQIILQYAV
jgi:acetylornithine/succinyldiaminopimelate/putrescine aminotransferase